ncbi:hypothetical protein LG293_17475 (plasmid) [Citricoccus nitrophenolicus]
MASTATYRLTRSVAALAIATVALTACAGTIREDPSGSPAEPSPSESAKVNLKWIDKTPAESQGPEITGDYQADLAAAGFEPSDDEFEHVMELHEKWICKEPADLDEEFSEFEETVIGFAENPSAGPDMIRVVVNYQCPTRIPALEDVLAGL